MLIDTNHVQLVSFFARRPPADHMYSTALFLLLLETVTALGAGAASTYLFDKISKTNNGRKPVTTIVAADNDMNLYNSYCVQYVLIGFMIYLWYI